MTPWQTLYPQTSIPTDEQITSYIHNPLWNQLNTRLQQLYHIHPKTEYSRCSMQAGWNVKYKKSNKALCTLYPMDGYFIALVVIGAKEMPEAELLIPSCTVYVQDVFHTTKEGMGQKWLMIDVKSEDILGDVLRLVALRILPRTT